MRGNINECALTRVRTSSYTQDDHLCSLNQRRNQRSQVTSDMSSSSEGFEVGGGMAASPDSGAGTAPPSTSASVSVTGPGSQWVQFEEDPPVFQQPAAPTDFGYASVAILTPTAAAAPQAPGTSDGLVPSPLTFTMPPDTLSPANPFVHHMTTRAGGVGIGGDVLEDKSPATLAQPHTENGAGFEKAGTSPAGTSAPLENQSSLDFQYSAQTGTGVFGSREPLHASLEDQMRFDGNVANGAGVFGPGSQPGRHGPGGHRRPQSHNEYPVGVWHYNICGCLTRPGMSVQTLIIPCYTAATNGEETGGNFWLHCAACLVPGVGQFVGANVRGRVRERYRISGNYATDLLAHCFVPCCAMIQEKRQMKSFPLPRNYHPPPEWQLRQQQQQSPPRPPLPTERY